MLTKNKPKLRYRKGIWECYRDERNSCFGYGRTPYEAFSMYLKCLNS
mgnify:CR=1 FL=1